MTTEKSRGPRIQRERNRRHFKMVFSPKERKSREEEVLPQPQAVRFLAVPQVSPRHRATEKRSHGVVFLLDTVS